MEEPFVNQEKKGLEIRKTLFVLMDRLYLGSGPPVTGWKEGELITQ